MSFSRADYGETTDASDVAQFLHDEITNKTIVVTGASPNTLGSEFVLTVCAHSPKLVVIATRDTKKLDSLAKDIASKYSNVIVKTLQLDLGSLESARNAGKEVMGWDDVEMIDVLVNNAGIMAVPYRKTSDGFESQFATNHLGHFVFTKQLMPKILASAKAGREPRIVNITSNGHRTHDINWESLDFHDGKTYNMWDAYGQSKTANMLFTVGLAEKYGDRGLYSYSVHPGMSGDSNLGKHLPMSDIQEFLDSGRAPEPDVAMIFKTLQQCTSTHVVASFDPEIKKYNGEYLLDCQVGAENRKKAYALDKENARKLWEISEQMTGEQFEE
ncbi:hypothetical protein ABW20_dc0108072 [Dactylellina cionopaga]|nr:hypothetical protein ABW20_dc0108072 [Dactylellina cionopaga]